MVRETAGPYEDFHEIADALGVTERRAYQLKGEKKLEQGADGWFITDQKLLKKLEKKHRNNPETSAKPRTTTIEVTPEDSTDGESFNETENFSEENIPENFNAGERVLTELRTHVLKRVEAERQAATYEQMSKDLAKRVEEARKQLRPWKLTAATAATLFILVSISVWMKGNVLMDNLRIAQADSQNQRNEVARANATISDREDRVGEYKGLLADSRKREDELKGKVGHLELERAAFTVALED